jgi:hypothetical protein
MLIFVSIYASLPLLVDAILRGIGQTLTDLIELDMFRHVEYLEIAHLIQKDCRLFQYQGHGESVVRLDDEDCFVPVLAGDLEE